MDWKKFLTFNNMIILLIILIAFLIFVIINNYPNTPDMSNKAIDVHRLLEIP